MVAYYSTAFILSLIMTLIYILVWHRHSDVHLTVVFVLVPIVNMGYMMLAKSQSLEAAIMANKITYLGGSFLLLFIMLGILKLCNIEYDRRINIIFVVISMLIYLSVLTIGEYPFFYKDVQYTCTDGIVELVKDYGPIHTVFYIMVVLYFLISLTGIIYSYFKKIETSNRIIYLLLISEIISMVAFFGGRMITKKIEFIPIVYVVDQLIYLLIAHRICLYDITDTGIDSFIQSGDTGLVSIDHKYNYLASNKTAKDIFTDLYFMKVDTSIENNEVLTDSILMWIKEFEKNPEDNKFHYNKNDKDYFVEVNYLFDGRRKRGFQIFVKDNTREQEYISMLNKYNANLHSKLEELYSSKEQK